MKYTKEEVVTSLLGQDDLENLAIFFKIFSDPTRLKILQVISFGEACVTDICQMTHLAQSTVSHQLATLRQQRIVKATKKGKSVFYELEDLHIMNIFNNALVHIKE